MNEVSNHRLVRHPCVCPVIDFVIRVGRGGHKEGFIVLPYFEVHCAFAGPMRAPGFRRGWTLNAPPRHGTVLEAPPGAPDSGAPCRT